MTRAEFIVSRNYRMPIYRDFQSIEEYIVLNLQNWVSQYSQGQWFILSFSAENSPKNPKILWKFRKFSGNSENSENSQKFLKICRKFWKFTENSLKRRSFYEALISYRIEKKTLISYRYRIESKKSLSLRGDCNTFYFLCTFFLARSINVRVSEPVVLNLG